MFKHHKSGPRTWLMRTRSLIRFSCVRLLSSTRRRKTRTSGNSTDDTLQKIICAFPHMLMANFYEQKCYVLFQTHNFERTIKYIAVTAEDKQETWKWRAFESLLWRLVKPTRVNQIELISALLEVTLACANFNLRIMQQSVTLILGQMLVYHANCLQG